MTITAATTAYISSSPRQSHLYRNNNHENGFRQSIAQSWKLPVVPRSTLASASKPKCQRPCPEPKEDIDLDRREAFFAMIGTIWATTTTTLVTTSLPAYAEYGADAKIEIPNPYQALADRSTKQCLVESLGNRDCLVYADEANALYRGADTRILLERIETASRALAQIPFFVEQKRWSQIGGVLTGPMGELIRTMGQVANLQTQLETIDLAKQSIRNVKNDLYAMSEAVARKDAASILKIHAAATNDLVAFVKSFV